MIMKKTMVIVLSAFALAAPFARAQDLNGIKAILEPHLQGHWEMRADTNPSIGPMLTFSPDATNRWRGFIGVVPFPQDEKGRLRIEWYMSTCAAPMYVLGHKTNCTAITTMTRSNTVCRTVVSVLGLTMPLQQTEPDKWINEGVLPTRRPRAEQSAAPLPPAPRTGPSEGAR